MRAIAAVLCALAVIATVAGSARGQAETSAPGTVQAGDLDRAYALVKEGKGAEAAPLFEAYVSAHPDDVKARRDFAYLLYSQKQLARAIEQMEAARKLDPTDGEIALQLGYWYLDAGRRQDALREFDAAIALRPADERPRLQRGYLLDERGDHYAAYRDFFAASRSKDPQVAAAGESALHRMAFFGSRPQPAPWFGEAYAEHRIAERFGTQAGNLILREGYALNGDSPWEAYLTVRVGWEREKATAALPLPLVDDSTLIGIGLRTRPLRSAPGLIAYAEYSRVAVTPKFTLEDERSDFRAGYYYYTEWAPKPETGHLYGRGRVRNLYSAGAYYSRFGDNWIGTARYRDGYRTPNGKRDAAELFVGAQVWRDTQGDFFNNVAEVGPGLRYLPDLPGNWQITVEYIRGFYLGNDGRTPNPFNNDYDDVRATIATFGYF